MRYAFLGFEVDDQLFELSREGTKLSVQPKALDILLHLLRHRDRVVSKQELMDGIWKGVKIQVNTLAQTVAVLRRALDDESERVIQTVRTRGYRFIADVSDVTQQPAPALSKPSGFFGRDAVVEALLARLDDAAHGRPGVALIAGAPGLGRTRLLAEFSGLARARGTRVVEVRCHAEGAPDFWPWSQTLRALDSAAEPLQERTDQPFQLFDSFARVLKAAAQREPIAILIDDMQWADVPSLLLLGFLARELRDAQVLLVVSYSHASMPHALARTVGALSREDPSRKLTLTPLGLGDIEKLVELRLGAPPGRDLTLRLARKTAGNPALLLQLLSDSPDQAADRDTSALLSDEGVREAIGVHLAVLPVNCQELLALAAVLGTEFDVGKVARLTGESEAAVLDELGEAARARIIAKTARPQEFRFLHAIVRDVLCRRLSATRRAEILAAAE